MNLKIINFIILVCVMTLTSFGFSTESSDNSKLGTTAPAANAVKIDSPPDVDGSVLDDPAWQNVKPVTGFWQTAPFEGEKSTEKTEVRIMYTSNTLYFGVVCYDQNPEGIIISDSRRDAELDESDAFQILLDTYRDRQNGFLFGTNPAGIEYDAQITNEGTDRFRSGGGGFNLAWDGSWEVKTRTSEIGWSAEFAIPFRTLRYSDEKEQNWGLNFQRNIRRRNETAFWVKLPRQFNIQKVSLAGELTGLKNIDQHNLKFMPYGLGEVSRDFEEQHDPAKNSNFGFDAKYSITPSLTLDATYNTDFAQVEVDELQINLDRFNLFFPEKRPFFLENAGFFGVGDPGEVELFFSRRIGIADEGQTVPILGGARLSGKSAGFNIGLLNMQTKSVSSDTIQANNFAVARISKQLPNRSSVGGIFVNRSGTGKLAPNKDLNQTFGVDGRLGIGKYLNLAGFAAKTRTTGLEDKDYAFKAGGTYDSPKWMVSATYTEVAENFNPEVGFLRRTGYRKPTFMILYRYRPQDFLGFLELRPHASYRSYWNFSGFHETGYWHIDNHWEWKNGYEIHTGINFTHEGVVEQFEIFSGVDVLPGNYDHAEAQLVFNTNRGAWWSTGFRSFIGGRFGGNRISFSPWFNFRFGETLNSEFILSRNDYDLPTGNFVTSLFQARISYSFSPKINLQALFQLNDKDDISVLNIRFNWQQTSNTGLFLVYKDSRFTENYVFDTPRFRSFVMKYTHLFDLLN